LVGLLAFSLPAGLNAAWCEGEYERATIAAERIDREWPLHPSGAELDEYIHATGMRLARLAERGSKITWRFQVIRNREPNAFAIGGGRVYVTDGAVLFARTESELAAVLAHEMGHQLAGHFCRGPRPGFWDSLFPTQDANEDAGGVRQRGIGSLTQIIDLHKEQEADALAVKLLSTGGYDPHAMLAVARRLHAGSNASQLDDARRVDALARAFRSLPTTQSDPQDSSTFSKLKQRLATELN
jgi:predicted Zn-dependent protease